jgi:hypothetical protein
MRVRCACRIGVANRDYHQLIGKCLINRTFPVTVSARITLWVVGDSMYKRESCPKDL